MMQQAQFELIELYLDDALDEGGIREVRRLLDESPEFRRELVWARQLRGHGAASSAAVVEALPGKVMERIDDLPPMMWPRAALRPEPPPVSSAGAWGWRRWAAVAALFAVFASLAGVYLWMQGNLGVVRECGGEAFLMRDGREIALASGAAIRVGDQIRVGKDGLTTVAYRDGTTLAVFPESQLVFGGFHGAKRLRLDSGAIHMNVAKQPDDRALEIATEHSRCTVRGTILDVTAARNCTRLEVQEGKVEMRATGQPETPVMVTAGQHAVTDGAAAPDLHAADEPVFRSAPLTRFSTPDGRVRITADIRGARKLYLVVGSGNSDNYYNSSIWINPRLSGPAGTLDLTKLAWGQGKSGWLKAPVPLINIDQTGRPLIVKGLPVSGIWAHAVSVIEYDLPPGYDRFDAEGALCDDPTIAADVAAKGRVIFEAYTQLTPQKLAALLASMSI